MSKFKSQREVLAALGAKSIDQQQALQELERLRDAPNVLVSTTKKGYSTMKFRRGEDGYPVSVGAAAVSRVLEYLDFHGREALNAVVEDVQSRNKAKAASEEQEKSGS